MPFPNTSPDAFSQRGQSLTFPLSPHATPGLALRSPHSFSQFYEQVQGCPVPSCKVILTLHIPHMSHLIFDEFLTRPLSHLHCFFKAKALEVDRRNSLVRDWQKIRIQETAEESAESYCRVPRTIEVELSDELVDCCVPGDSLQALITPD